MQSFSFNPPSNSVEEGKWLIAVSSFEFSNSVFNITNENTSFSITILGHWETESDRKTFAKINELLDLRSFELHVKEVRKKGKKTQISDNEYKLSDIATQKKTRYLKN